MLPGAGNSQQVLQYTGVDDAPLTGISYYRLKQTDLDGTSTWSDIVPVEISAEHGPLLIYPVPATTGPITFIAPEHASGSAHISILDNAGRTIASFNALADAAGRVVLQRDALLGAMPGIYHVLFDLGDQRSTGTLSLQ